MMLNSNFLSFFQKILPIVEEMGEVIKSSTFSAGGNDKLKWYVLLIAKKEFHLKIHPFFLEILISN